MNLVFVDQEKNTKNVVEPYKNIIVEIKTIKTNIMAVITKPFDFKITSKSFSFDFNELN